jgi:hypothetical protein
LKNASFSIDNLDKVNFYEELKDDIDLDATNAETSAKNLSLKLLGTQTPQEVLMIFENQYIRQPNREIHGEELVMLLKFLQHTIKQTLDREDASILLEEDHRIQTLIDWLMARYENLDLEYKVATTFALGMLVS